MIDAQQHVNSFTKPASYNLNAWQSVKQKAMAIWECYLAGEEWNEEIAITCKESYLMLVDSSGQLIVRDNNLLSWVHNRHNAEWLRKLETIALQAVKSGNFDRALLYFNKALRLRPHSFINLYRRGVVKMKLYHYKGALEDFGAAIAIDPNNELVYIKRGVLYSMLDMDQRAMDDYNKAIRIAPESSEAYQKRGLLRHSLGDIMGAKADLKMANRLVPSKLTYLNGGLNTHQSNRFAA